MYESPASPQVHEHLPVYTAGIQEFQTRLDHLQIEQAKLAETLANDKRYCGWVGGSSDSKLQAEHFFIFIYLNMFFP